MVEITDKMRASAERAYERANPFLTTGDHIDAVAAVLSAIAPMIAAQVKERAAQAAVDHLEAWSDDLFATRDDYISASRSGVFGGRKIDKDLAQRNAREFRQRAEAVHEAAQHTAAAIRAIAAKVDAVEAAFRGDE